MRVTSESLVGAVVVVAVTAVASLIIGCRFVADKPRNLSPDDLAVMLELVKNDKIEWDGDVGGLLPLPSDRLIRALESHGDSWIPILMVLLEDRERFAAAHVAITVLTDADRTRNSTHWNGLHVELNADGSATYDPDDIPTLVKYWKKLQPGR